jgi:hypothetical protein
MDKLGTYAAIVGVVLAILGGFVVAAWVLTVLTILGVIVGLMNVGKKEVKDFLLACVALVVVSALGANGLANIS